MASLDEEVRSLLRTFSDQWGRIKTVAWVNPTNDARIVTWLSSGALPEKERLLGYEGD